MPLFRCKNGHAIEVEHETEITFYTMYQQEVIMVFRPCYICLYNWLSENIPQLLEVTEE